MTQQTTLFDDETRPVRSSRPEQVSAEAGDGAPGTEAPDPADGSEAAGRAGFEKTKVGWVPEDWEVVKLGDCGKWHSGGTPSRSNPAYWNGDIPWVSAKSFSFYLSTAEEHVTEQGAKAGSRIVPEGTVLLLVRGMGLAKEFPVALTQRPVAFNQDVKAIRPREQVDADYLAYALKGREPRVMHLADSTSHGTLRLHTGTLSNLRLPLPPLPEQRRIAAVLATWDRALARLDDLLAAKQRRKRALMQRLLIGHVRFAGFEGEAWREVKLGDIANYYSGLSGKSSKDFGEGQPYVPYKNIFENSTADPENLDYVQIGEDESQNRVQYGDLLVTTSSEVPEEVGMTSVVLWEPEELYLNSFCFGVRFRSFDMINPEFASHFFRSSPVRRAIFPLAQGSTRFNLSRRKFMRLEVKLPSSLAEQKKIASVLSACDAEIEALRRERAALQRQKKGMMQQLLTGRVRVNEDLEKDLSGLEDLDRSGGEAA